MPKVASALPQRLLCAVPANMEGLTEYRKKNAEKAPLALSLPSPRLMR